MGLGSGAGCGSTAAQLIPEGVGGRGAVGMGVGVRTPQGGARLCGTIGVVLVHAIWAEREGRDIVYVPGCVF